VSSLGDALDRAAGTLAVTLLDGLTARLDPARREWLAAVRIELDEVEGGWQRLLWALGGLRLAWAIGKEDVLNRRQLERLCGLGAAALALPVFGYVFFGPMRIGQEAISRGSGGLLALFFAVVALLAGGLAVGAVLHARRSSPAGLALLWVCPLLLVAWLVLTGTPLVTLGLVPLVLGATAAVSASARRWPA
jgi:hypothetical protein